MDRSRFAGQVVLITGAASGIGAAAAARFASEGAALALCDVSAQRLDDVARRLRESGAQVFHETVDVTDPLGMQQFIARTLATLGGLDVAINNAGIAQVLRPLQQIPVEEFDAVMAVNVRGVFLGMQAQLPPMLARKKGVILNIASAAGLVGAGHMAAYAASKHAVVGLTRAAADETARRGIRVNALCPSFTATPLFDAMADQIAERDKSTRAVAAAHIGVRVPMARVARTDEIVQAMVWMCGAENSFMTGQAIAIDGGLTAI
ncbi:MAG: NAD(P)-dependent dehydrogenase (short-subunit alcohol dehydrogenase family) [Paracoccaceae bacterium]|jgi:NAD(P)-dependent dehydrogenase (short-subunit alcohol dehydrogenase family)